MVCGIAELHRWVRRVTITVTATHRSTPPSSLCLHLIPSMQVLEHFKRLSVEVAGCPWRAVLLDDEQYGGNDVSDHDYPHTMAISARLKRQTVRGPT